MTKIILDLCGGTGAWSCPYAKAVAKRITARYAMALNLLNSREAQRMAERGTLEVDVIDLLEDFAAQAVREAVEKEREMLKKYGRHLDSCHRSDNQQSDHIRKSPHCFTYPQDCPGCNCGLDTALRATPS